MYMKDFFKWLGVNEKVAKATIWIFVIMLFLVVTNLMLESLGFPFYKITYENLTQVNTHKILEYVLAWITTILSFYTVVLLVFPVKNIKRIFKYSVLFLILNITVRALTNTAVNQLFMAAYVLTFCYFYSGRNWKYMLYGLMSLIANSFIQAIWYLSKARFIDYASLSQMTKSILSLDYFIIVALIILVKEIWLKKRGANNG